MKTTRIMLSLLLAMVLVLGLCACGGKNEPAPQAEPQNEPAPAEEPAAEEEPDQEPAPEPEPTQEPEPEPTEEPALPTEGVYTLFAIESGGFALDPEEIETHSVLTLDEGGTGYMTIDDEGMDVTSWTEEDGTVTITMADGSSAEAVVKNGILEMDLYGGGEMVLCYAQDGVDTSAYTIMTMDEMLEASMPDSRLYAFWSGLDTETGVHMRYDMHSDYMDSDSSFDVHGKGGSYYSLRTTKVGDIEGTTATFCQDGKVYNLYPDEMRGVFVTETSAGVLTNGFMSMDSLFALIMIRAQETEYAEETREIDGVEYAAEVFPATDYQPEAVFCFDDAGQLVHVIEGAPVVDTSLDIGETVYRIEAIDDEVDESLFDISAYDISE